MAAYFVFHNRIDDEKQMQEYLSKSLPTLTPYPHEILVADGNSEVIEGKTNLPRTVVVRFESREAALAWYNSPAYQAVLPMRLGASEGYAVLVDGLERAGARAES